MSHELLFTSAPRGLKPGSQGFCTVQATRGLPAPLMQKLEEISFYRQVFPPNHADAGRNPVNLSHLRLNVGGRPYHVLSRIAPQQLEYSGRTNYLAHHVVLEPGELPRGGPAWALAQAGFVETAWDGEVSVLPAGRRPPQGDALPGVCRIWQALTGDAGWGGVLAETYERDPQRLVFLIFEPGLDLLPLFQESLALLPAESRWQVSFSSYFTSPLQGIGCLWRGVVRGSEEAKNAARLPGALVLNLCGEMPVAPDCALVQTARTGRVTAALRQPVSTRPVPVAAAPTSGQDVVLVQQANDASAGYAAARIQDPSAPLLLEPAEPRGRGLAFVLGAVLGLVLAGGAGAAVAWVLTTGAEKQRRDLEDSIQLDKDRLVAEGKQAAQAVRDEADKTRKGLEKERDDAGTALKAKTKELEDKERDLCILQCELEQVRGQGGEQNKAVAELQKQIAELTQQKQALAARLDSRWSMVDIDRRRGVHSDLNNVCNQIKKARTDLASDDEKAFERLLGQIADTCKRLKETPELKDSVYVAEADELGKEVEELRESYKPFREARGFAAKANEAAILKKEAELKKWSERAIEEANKVIQRGYYPAKKLAEDLRDEMNKLLEKK